MRRAGERSTILRNSISARRLLRRNCSSARSQRRLRRPASSPFSEEPVFSDAVSFGISASKNITFALHQGIPNTAKGCSV